MDDRLKQLSHHQSTIIGLDECKKSAVCIPLLRKEQGYDILFEVRSGKIKHQPGDICFPGGMVEPSETSFEAAVRETQEELLLSRDQIEVIGRMDVFLHTGTGLLLSPYAAILHDYEGTYSEDEVAEVFTVPLDFFLHTEPEVYEMEEQVLLGDDFPFDRILGGREYRWRKRKETVYFYQYGHRTIWGLTGKIIHSFAKIYAGPDDGR